MNENYPTFHALSYEFWAYAHVHPVLTILIVVGTATVITWLGKDWD